MKRSALLGVLLCAGTMAFCQSKANPSFWQNAGRFSFSNDQLPQPGLSAFKIADSCEGLSKDRKQTDAQVDFDQLFRAPCTNVSTRPALMAKNDFSSFRMHPTLMAKNDFSTFQFPRGLSPNGKFKFEPIPTQWPNAKFEPIPTQWPDLEMVPITGRAPVVVPAAK